MIVLAGFASLAAVVAAFLLYAGFSAAKSAPQEAAIAALAVAIAAIPYVLFRVVQIVLHHNAEEKFRSDVLKALGDLPRTPHVPAVVASAPPVLPPAKLVREASMGSPGWAYKLYDDGSVKVRDPHGGAIEYASIEAARKEISWWRES